MSCGDLTCSAGIIANLDQGNALDPFDVPYGVFTSIENLTGSPYEDELTGDGGRNALDGGGGDDMLKGGAGKDRLFGGDDIDRLKAKDGARDRTIDCGPGANAEESARYDKDKDPRPRSC